MLGLGFKVRVYGLGLLLDPNRPNRKFRKTTATMLMPAA